jgi:serine phosphatase RsbU (regulator of sigma subunit)
VAVIERPVLAVLAALAVAAAVVWGRSARRLRRASRRITLAHGEGSEAAQLAEAAYRKDLHTAFLYLVLAMTALVESLRLDQRIDYVLLLGVLPILVSLRYAATFVQHARLAEARSQLEQRAQEVLTQEDLAPRRWAARLAPETVAAVAGFELGALYRAGTGMMAGDFYDVLRTAPSRVAAVIGDVSGHGIEPSITAFQAKHLLRVFLHQYRDPAQALEELNAQLTNLRSEEFISMAVVVFDTEAGTLRYASAGHPTAFLWHEGDVRRLTPTGPIIGLTLDASFTSKEVPLQSGDLLLLYTDGLAEARNGEQLFGEDRIAGHLRRDPGADPDILCKTLMEAAEDFATIPLTDDTAILAIRRI